MSYDEPLVGSLAIIIAVAAVAIAIGPWSQPYRLKTISAVNRRFGKPAARGVWIAIAIAALTAGFAILSGVRPGYAVPAHRINLER
jgi:hypothetical protein